MKDRANTWKEFVLNICYENDGEVYNSYIALTDLTKYCTLQFEKRLLKALKEGSE